MKRIIFILICLCNLSFAIDFDKQYLPTRKEWLEQVLMTKVPQVVLRDTGVIGPNINVADRTVYCILVFPNFYNTAITDVIKKNVEQEIRTILSYYSWAKSMKISIKVQTLS